MSGFPKVVLAGLIVSAGIYLADQYDSRASWLMAFFVLLVVAFAYPAFGDEIMKLFGSQGINQETKPPSNMTPPNVVQPGITGPVPGTYA